MSDEELLEFMEEEGGGVTPTTWNPSDKSANITLSNGNLTATNGVASYRGVRSIASSSAAKWYYESVYATSPWGGFATSVMNLDSVVSVGALAYFGNGSIYEGATLKVSGLPASTTFTTLRFAIDIGAQKLWVGDEGGWWNGGDPGAGTNPTYSGFAAATYFAMCSIINTAGLSECTSDFGQSPAYAVPAGFTSVG